MSRIFLPAVFGLLALVTACGGDGGSGSPGNPAQPAPTYVIGGAVSGLRTATTVTLRLANGDVLAQSANGAFAFTTRFQQGASYQVSVDRQPTGPDQICSVSNGTGVVGNADVTTVAVNCVTTAVVNIIVANATGQGDSDGFVRSFVLDTSTGVLTSKSVVGAPGGASTIVFSNQSREITAARWTAQPAEFGRFGVATPYFFNANADLQRAGTVSTAGDQLLINPVNGLQYGSIPGGFSQLPVERFPTYKEGTVFLASSEDAVRDPILVPPRIGRGLRRISLDSSAGLIFVTVDGDGDVAQASIRSLTIANPKLPTISSTYTLSGRPPFALALHPSRRFLYATLPGGTSALMFSYDTAGVLAPIFGGTFVAPANARAAIVSADGAFLYLASFDTGRVQAYAIGTNGVPTPIGDSVLSGTRPVAMIFDPDGRFLYVLNRGEDAGTSSISGYRVGADGGLSPVAGSPFQAGTLGSAIISARFTPGG